MVKLAVAADVERFLGLVIVSSTCFTLCGLLLRREPFFVCCSHRVFFGTRTECREMTFGTLLTFSNLIH
jgi:hypothetical protein